MILGNAGFVSAIASILLSLIDPGSTKQMALRLGFLLGGAGLIWLAASSSLLDRQLSRVIEWALRKWTRLDVFDYLSLLGLREEYGIRRFVVQENDWLAGKSLAESNLRQEGALVLIIQRNDGESVRVPAHDVVIHPGDKLILYGQDQHLEELSNREQTTEGDNAHGEAVEKQQNREREQKRREQRRNR